MQTSFGEAKLALLFVFMQANRQKQSLRNSLIFYLWQASTYFNHMCAPVCVFLHTLPANIHRWGKRQRLRPRRWRTVWGNWSCSGWFPGLSAPPRTWCAVTSPPWTTGWRLKCASVNCCSPPAHIWHSSCLLWPLGAVGSIKIIQTFKCHADSVHTNKTCSTGCTKRSWK